MKKVLRIAAVVLFFLLWLIWCFSDYISGVWQSLSSAPEITALTVVFMLGLIVLGAALVIVAFGVLLVLVILISKIALHTMGLRQEAKAVENLYRDDNAAAFCACLFVFMLLVITCVTKTEFMLRLIG